MFANNKYTTIYYKLINRYGNSENGEIHHIQPKSLGGDNSVENLIKVPTRVHYILHKLLVKMTTTKEHTSKMEYALWRMMNPQSKYHERNYRVTSHDYTKYKSIFIERMKKSNPMKREEVRNKIRGDNNPMKREEVRDKIRGDANPMKREDVRKKFRKKRPEQSIVVSKRNEIYWKTRARPLRNFNCPICNTLITTRKPNKKFCSKKCYRISIASVSRCN